MDPKKRLNMLKQTPAKLLKLNDSFIALAANLEKELKTLREKENALNQERNDLKKVYMEAVLAKHRRENRTGCQLFDPLYLWFSKRISPQRCSGVCSFYDVERSDGERNRGISFYRAGKIEKTL